MTTLRTPFPLILILAVGAIAFAPHAAAQRTVENYDAVLVPFHGSYQGSSGHWATEVWIWNDGDSAADVFPVGYYLLAPCRVCDVSVPPAPSLKPRATLYHFSDFLNEARRPFRLLQSNSTPGAYMWIENDKLDQVRITSTIQWISESSTNPPVEIPVVPVRRFSRTVSSIHGVRLHPSSRYAYRLFGSPDTPPGAQIRVDTYVVRRDRIEPPAERLIGSEIVQLLGDFDASMPPCLMGDCSPLSVPVKPVYAQRFALPGIDNGASDVTVEGDWVRVTFTPLSDGTRFWALVSGTTSSNIVTVYPLPY